MAKETNPQSDPLAFPLSFSLELEPDPAPVVPSLGLDEAPTGRDHATPALEIDLPGEEEEDAPLLDEKTEPQPLPPVAPSASPPREAPEPGDIVAAPQLRPRERPQLPAPTVSAGVPEVTGLQ